MTPKRFEIQEGDGTIRAASVKAFQHESALRFKLFGHAYLHTYRDENDGGVARLLHPSLVATERGGLYVLRGVEQ